MGTKESVGRYDISFIVLFTKIIKAIYQILKYYVAFINFQQYPV